MHALIEQNLNTYIIYRTSPMAASDSFRFPACNFNKKKTPVKMFICELCEIFKNIFRQKHLRMTVSCAYLWILRSFSEIPRCSMNDALFSLYISCRCYRFVAVCLILFSSLKALMSNKLIFMLLNFWDKIFFPILNLNLLNYL